MSKLGDPIDFKFSKEAMNNINLLLTLAKSRLVSSGKVKTLDSKGNPIYTDVDIFSNETLLNFLILSMSDFNQVPEFTNFTLEDNDIVNRFKDIFVEGITLYALGSKALIEKGREYTVEDNGVGFDPPKLSELLNTQYSELLTHHFSKLCYIKARM